MLLVALVLCTAIIGFFSQEFLHFFKWFFSKPGVKLFFPLIFMSFVVESYALWGWKGLTAIGNHLSIIEHRLAALLPFQTGAMVVVRAFILFIIASIPLCITYIRSRKKHFSHAMYWGYFLSAVLWTVSVILLISLSG